MNFSHLIKKFGCFTVFITPFFLGFLYFQYYIISNSITLYKIQKWEKLPAKVDSVSMAYSSSSKGGYSERVSINYFYKVKGKTYKNDDVGVFYGMNNIENHSEIYSKLESADSIYIYVNPSLPSESYISQRASNVFPILLVVDFLVLTFIGLFTGGFGLSLRHKFTNNEIFNL